MFHHIIAIIGASGSGKTSLSLQAQAVGIPSIVSYTTRPMREGEHDGIDHHFITDEVAEQMLTDHRELAKTIYGGHLYFALFIQLHNLPICTYVIDEIGLRNMKDNINELGKLGISKDDQYKIYPLIIERPDTTGIAADRTARDTDRPVCCSSIEALSDNLAAGFGCRIRVINDSPSAAHFNSWSIAFAVAFFTAIETAQGIKTCTLHTSDDSVSSIQKKLILSYDINQY